MNFELKIFKTLIKKKIIPFFIYYPIAGWPDPLANEHRAIVGQMQKILEFQDLFLRG